ncbi:MAG: hypothetical protein ACFBSG_12070 [Leptolyngbyaceae cyanobacterium]
MTRLDLKTAWMDEVSTVIFSLGNSSYLLPVNQIVDLEALLAPITTNAANTPWDSARYLLQENNHPPLYFMLAHPWMDLFSSSGATASLAKSRAFSAFWGSLSIPAIFWAAKSTFRSPLAGVLSAAFLAVSPFSIFLSQEARHYGLAITMVSLSLACFATVTRAVLVGQQSNWLVSLAWATINALAFANHYFSALTFIAQGIVLAAIAARQARQQGLAILRRTYWWPIYGVAIATALSILVWLPVLLNFYGSPQTTFLREENASLMKWINPVAQSFAAVITSFITPANFFAQKPIHFILIGFTILSTLLFITVFVPAMWRGAKRLNQEPEGHTGIIIVGGFWVAMLALFALICYVQGSDITRGLRYMFSYYPAVMVLAGGVFAHYWRGNSPQSPASIRLPIRQWRLSGRRFVQLTWFVGLLSALMIVHNLAFPKYYAPDRFVPFIQTHSTQPIVIASTERIFAQPTVIGAKFLSLGWEIDRNFHPADAASSWQTPPKFFAIQQGYDVEKPVAESFAQMVKQLETSVDLWVIRSEIDPADPLITAKPNTCKLADNMPQGNKGGYLYIHFLCGKR